MTATFAPASTLDRPAAPAPTAHRGRALRLLRGPDDHPSWARPALLVLLLATLGLYAWDLSASGYANSFYAAAVQSGTKSWTAWFFGSLDAGNSITVDKPPASLWVMGLSARVFGFNSWSLLLPQAVEGVAAVGLLYGAVRRAMGGRHGHVAGLIAGAVLALTPAAVLMFRFDNPDALLVLLMTLGAYGVVRAIHGSDRERSSGEAGRTRWLVVAGTAIGFAFLTKMLQGLLVVPGLGLAYLVAGPVSFWKRCWQLLVAVVAMVVSAGWFVVTVALWPAASRPYIGGSGDNSVLGLAFGYNGLSRLEGGAGNGGMGGSGTTGTSFGGATGIARLFSAEFGNEVSWLLPAALAALVAGLWLTLRTRRTDGVRASLLLWGGWLLVTGAVFAEMKGTVHPYYTVAMAPAIGALVAIGGVYAWQRRERLDARLSVAAVVAAAGVWSLVLLGRVSSWHPELRVLIGALTALAVVGVLLPPTVLGRATSMVAVSAVLAGILGTGAFAAATAASPHTGSIPTVGPAVAAVQSGGMGGGMGGGGTGGGFGGGPGGSTSTSTSASQSPSSQQGGPGGGMGGSTSTALVSALRSSTQTWSAAVSGDQTAAELELASGTSVIAIGGWSGSDASPTLAQFEQWVAQGKIHYYVAGGGMDGGPGGGTGSASAIEQWVEAHYTSTTIGGSTVYDLTATAK